MKTIIENTTFTVSGTDDTGTSLELRLITDIPLAEVASIFRGYVGDINIFSDNGEELIESYTGYNFVRQISSVCADPEYVSVILERNNIEATVALHSISITEIQEALAELYEMINGAS